MEWWIFVGVVAGLVGLGFLAQRMGWIDLAPKKRSSGSYGGLMGSLDEVFHPSRHFAQLERDRQTALPAPAPIPGDGDKGIVDGRIHIDLSALAEPGGPNTGGPNTGGPNTGGPNTGGPNTGVLGTGVLGTAAPNAAVPGAGRPPAPQAGARQRTGRHRAD